MASSNVFLFPQRAKYYGLILILAALIFGYLYFWGGRPEAFNTKVFAIVSAYLESRYLTIVQTNMLDELAAILFIGGLTLFSFSKQKHETEMYNTFRLKALVHALYISAAIWILLFLLVYGWAIFLVSSLIFIVFLVFYNVFFQYYRKKYGQAFT